MGKVSNKAWAVTKRTFDIRRPQPTTRESKPQAARQRDMEHPWVLKGLRPSRRYKHRDHAVHQYATRNVQHAGKIDNAGDVDDRRRKIDRGHAGQIDDGRRYGYRRRAYCDCARSDSSRVRNHRRGGDGLHHEGLLTADTDRDVLIAQAYFQVLIAHLDGQVIVAIFQSVLTRRTALGRHEPLADRRRFLVEDGDFVIVLRMHADYFPAFLVLEHELVVAVAARRGVGLEAGLSLVPRKIIGIFILAVIDGSDHQRVIRVALLEYYQHFHAHARNELRAPFVGGPQLCDTHAARDLLTLPKEFHLDAAEFIDVDLSRSDHLRGLRAVDQRFGRHDRSAELLISFKHFVIAVICLIGDRAGARSIMLGHECVRAADHQVFSAF